MKNFLEKKYVQIGVTAFCVIAASLLFWNLSHSIDYKGIKGYLQHSHTDCVCGCDFLCSVAAYPFYGEKYYLSDL